MSSPSPSIRHQRSLDFYEEIQRRKIPTFQHHDNQRFAHEMIPKHFFEKDTESGELLITENLFRRFNGAAGRFRNGYCSLVEKKKNREIALFKKPFRDDKILLAVVGEFLVVHLHHCFNWDPLQSTAQYEERETDVQEEGNEHGQIARTLVRRYMLPRDFNIATDIAFETRGNVTEIVIKVRRPTPPRERNIPIVVAE